MESFAYQYLVGGLVFVAGLIVAWRTGQIGWEPGRRGRLLVLTGGLAFFFALQGVLLLLAG